MKRRTLLQGALIALLGPIVAHARTQPVIDVYKTPTCGCCQDWVTHLEQNGFKVIVHEVPSTKPYRNRFGVPAELASCHTGFVDGYAVEGHVPAAEIKRMLKERPKALGLSVPGMPIGSPGMEVEGTRRDAFNVVLFGDNGSHKVYRSYTAQP